MIVSEGKATVSEIDSAWSYSDLLKCVLYSDIEAIQRWKSYPKQNDSQDEIFVNF